MGIMLVIDICFIVILTTHHTLSMGKQMKHETEIIYRMLNLVDPVSFGKDIQESLKHLVTDGAPSIDIAVMEYNQTLTMVLDMHALLRKKHIKSRKLQSWFTDKIIDEI